MKKIISCLLAAVMMTTLFCTQAFAAEYSDLPFTATKGEKFRTEWTTPNAEEITRLELGAGYLPDGITVTKSSKGNTVVVTGTATETGSFYADVEVETNSNNYVLCIMAEVVDAPEKYSVTVDAAVGVEITEKEVIDVGEMIQESRINSGSLPSGITCTQYDTYFTVSGTPKESGSSSVTYYCTTEGGSCYVTINFDIKGSAKLAVTKSPTSETVDAGGKATFISAAENYSDVEWRVVTKDGSNCWRNKSEIEAKFTGVSVNIFKDDDDEREYLVLSNIPSSMNGYYIQTKFWSTDKSETAFTKETSCLLTVNAELKVPTITAQPASVSKTVGEAATLTVTASDPNGGTLRYQWYSNTQPTTVGGSQISGAISSSYTPPQTEGTIYYYVSVTSAKDGRTSTPVKSAATAVTYTAAVPTPTPTPTAAPTPTPGIDDPSVSPAAETPVPTPAQNTKSSSKLGSFIFYIVLVIVLTAVLAILILVAKRGDAIGISLPASPFWTCPNCGKRNKGHFCSECGTAKPEDEDSDIQ